MRDGDVNSRVGAPQFSEVLLGFPAFMRNITLTGGVFDRTLGVDAAPASYKAMADREASKVLVRT